MLEFLLAEWHLDPVYIAESWTDEMLQIMIEKLADRKQRINDAMAGKVSSPMPNQGGDRKVSDTELFRQLGKKIKVMKHGD